MIVVYEKGTNKFVGMAPRVYDNGVMRDYKMTELYPKLDPSKHGSFIVPDSPEFLAPGVEWQFKVDKNGTPTGLEAKAKLSIRVTTNALDKDGDGSFEILVKEVPPAGKSERPWINAELTVQLMEGNKLYKKAVDVLLSTTGGTLSSRKLTTNGNGKATSSLVSGYETVTINITASAENMETGGITFEVLPYEDFEKLHGPLPKTW